MKARRAWLFGKRLEAYYDGPNEEAIKELGENVMIN